MAWSRALLGRCGCVMEHGVAIVASTVKRVQPTSRAQQVGLLPQPHWVSFSASGSRRSSSSGGLRCSKGPAAWPQGSCARSIASLSSILAIVHAQCRQHHLEKRIDAVCSGFISLESSIHSYKSLSKIHLEAEKALWIVSSRGATVAAYRPAARCTLPPLPLPLRPPHPPPHRRCLAACSPSRATCCTAMLATRLPSSRCSCWVSR